MKARSSSSSAQLARQHGFAHAMRRDPTASERALWEALRSSQLGVGFRRQAVVAVTSWTSSLRLVSSSWRLTAATTVVRLRAARTPGGTAD